MSHNEERIVKMLEQLLAISSHFTDNMPAGERQQVAAIAAAVKEIRECDSIC